MSCLQRVFGQEGVPVEGGNIINVLFTSFLHSS